MKSILNKKAFKIATAALVALIVAGSVTGGVYALASQKGAGNASAPTKAMAASAAYAETHSNTDGKEETVYAIADANGAVQKVIVSEWLKNGSQKAALDDYTELTGIKNTQGDEKFTGSGGALSWAAAGNDIHYQGTTQKALPVQVAVTYYLNGSPIKPADLAGKSGHIKIRFDYTNTQKATATVDGAQEDVSVPFLMVSGVALDGDKFANDSVSTGKVVGDGSRSIVFGFAIPGLSDSLKLGTYGSDVPTVDIPSSVEIEADTTNFVLPATLTVGMTGLFDDVKLDSDSTVQDLKDSLKKLTDAAQELMDGASDLYDGTSELYNKSQGLEDGAGSLLSGAKAVNDGAAKANGGASQLKDGLATLSKSSKNLDDGGRQVVDAVFASVTTQLRAELVSSGLMSEAAAAGITLTRSNYTAVFKQLSAAATVTPAQVEAQLRGKLSSLSESQQNLAICIAYDLIAAKPSLSINDALSKAGSMMHDAGTAQAAYAAIDAAWLADAGHQALIAAVQGATGADADTSAKIAAVALALDSGNPSSKIGDAAAILTNASKVAATTVSADKITALCTALANAATSTGNASLDAVKSKLDDVMQFYNGLLIYTDGVDSAYGGAKQLADGTGDLASGAKQLYAGAGDLYQGTEKLVAGADDLNDGAKKLKDGLNDFYNDGIKKLSDTMNGSLIKLLDRMKAVADAGQAYTSFAGKPSGMSGSVKFIYRTDSIGE